MDNIQSKKLLVQSSRRYSFRLLDIETNDIYRALNREHPELAVGALLVVQDLVLTGDLIESMNIIMTVKGDTEKEREIVDSELIGVGDLVDGVPVLRLGKRFYKDGKKVAYAYFSAG